jgi:hypothetical protein
MTEREIFLGTPEREEAAACRLLRGAGQQQLAKSETW